MCIHVADSPQQESVFPQVSTPLRKYPTECEENFYNAY